MGVSLGSSCSAMHLLPSLYMYASQGGSQLEDVELLQSE